MGNGKNCGVKVEEPGKPLRWYTSERHTGETATELADSYNRAARQSGSPQRFRADEIPIDEKY